MHGYYLRVVRFVSSVSAARCDKRHWPRPILNLDRKLHVYSSQNYTFCKMCGDSPVHKINASDSPSLFSNILFRNYYNIKYYSQLNAGIKILTEKKMLRTRPMSSVAPSQLETPNDQKISDPPVSQVKNESDLFEDINYDEIAGGDEEKINSFKLLVLELDVMRQDGMPVPSKMSMDQWKELFALQSRSQRRKYLTYLFKTEMKKLSDRRKKDLKRIAREQSIPETESEQKGIRYGFQGSTIFLRIYDTTVNNYDNNRLFQAMRFGQDLVIDCGFYNDMNQMENKLCCKQLVYLFAENRISKDPFNLHFCNLKKDSCLYKFLKNGIPTIEDPAFPINIHEEHYSKLFPKEKLVYLTPHCNTELKEFNSNDVYIVGAIVDRVNQTPLTLAKAKSEGLRMAQLPLDRYLDWGIGNKSLTVNQVVKIMHDLQLTGNWDIALKHVPQRKIRQPGEPMKDRRKPYNRGSTFHPHARLNKYD